MKIIKLSQGCEALVDDKDFEMLNKFNWCVIKSRNTFYARRTKWNGNKSHSIIMHRLIMGLEKGDGSQIDHRDGNGLNNIKSNLRLCTSSQNRQNQFAIEGNVNFKGVGFNKRSGKYRARIMKHGEQYSLNEHKTPKQAALAYN
ncbi:hypothetical protein LCGC14_2723370, partial [marine sediment metagenome]